jgi:hypothetical protein
MQNLNIRYPYLYTTSTCTRCSKIENTLHLILCSNNNINIQQSLINIIHQTLLSINISNISSTNLLNILLNFTLYSPNPQYHFIINSIVGTFTTITYNHIKILTQKQTNTFLTNLSNNLLNWYYEDLWFPRNTHQHNWEQSRNITSKTKRSKITLPILSTPRNTNTNTIQIVDTSIYIEKWFKQGFSLTTCFN